MSQKAYPPHQRYQLARQVLDIRENSDCSISQACAAAGISRSSFNRWCRKLLDENHDYLEAQAIPSESKRPKYLARQTSEATKQRVIDEASKPHHTSANSITQQLKHDGLAIGNGTVIKILEEAGLYGTIHTMNANGELRRKRGLLRLCEKRQQGPIEKR